MGIGGDLLKLAEEWASFMESRGERVSGPRRLRVAGRNVFAIRSFTDTQGHVTAFTEEGDIVTYLPSEVVAAGPRAPETRAALGVARLMKDPSRWPLGRVLALVHPERAHEGGLASTAFLVRGRGPRLYLGNVGALDGRPLDEQLEELPSFSYESFEAIVADGWRVD